GHALIGRALYLAEACAADEEHRELVGIPEEVTFATKPQLVSGLLAARSLWGSAPPSWPAMKCVAAASCAAASASARWARGWRPAPTTPLLPARAAPWPPPAPSR